MRRLVPGTLYGADHDLILKLDGRGVMQLWRESWWTFARVRPDLLFPGRGR